MRPHTLLTTLTLSLLLLLSACSPDPDNNPRTPNTRSEQPAPAKQFPELITFPSKDGLAISANLYHHNDSAPVLILCHQARFNKFEYDGIAPKLHEMGFNCLAIDQRSGGPISSQPNLTKRQAVKEGKETGFLDAEQDMVAAVEWAHEKYNAPVYLWGSSYSATLTLYILGDNENLAGALSFSPGDYLAEDKGASLKDVLKGIEKPFFITSSLPEAKEVSGLLAGKTLNDQQTQFIPVENGHHGSRALWEGKEGGEEYWEAVTAFLNQIK